MMMLYGDDNNRIMGIFLKALQRAQQSEIDQFFSSNSLTKIKEYYGLFKNISETYSIDNEQFMELFGRHQQIFKCFDTDNNLLIDGLELFSGLIVLSRNIQYHDKVTFLFELFDFNDLKSLSKTDIEFLFISATNAVSKIYQLKNIHDDNYIQEFVKEAFPNEERVNISEMLKWSQESQTVRTFFQLIHYQAQGQVKGLLAGKIYLKLEDSADNASPYHYKNQQKFMLDTQKFIKFPEQEPELDMKNYDINPSARWVYGIRYKDVKQFIEYVSNGAEELVIYYVAKVAVVYNIKSHQQTHYLAHRHQIISLAVMDSLCATGEYAQVPQIRVWDYRTFETIQILKGNHVKGVHLLKFIDNGLLVSCGCLEQSPIVIFDIESGETIFSTYCNSPAIEICRLQNFTNRATQQFIVCSLYELYHFESLANGEESAISLKKLSLDANTFREAKITTCCFFMINAHFRHLRQYDERVEKYVMTGHENGLVSVWNLQKREKEYVFSHERNEIVRLIPTHNYLLVLTNSSFISYYSIDLTEKDRIKVIDITQTDDQLASYDVCECLPNLREHKLLIVTQKGDLFFLHQQCESVPSLSHFSQRKYRTQKIQQIFPIAGKIRMQKLLKKEQSQNLYLAIDHTIKAIDTERHTFIREWNIGQQIVGFDVIHTRNHGLFMVAATRENQIYSFANTSESISRAKIDTEVVSVKAHAEESSMNITVIVSTKEGLVKYNMVRNAFANQYPIIRPNLCPQLSELQGNKIMLSDQNNQLSRFDVKEGNHIQALLNSNYRTSASPLKIYYHIPVASSKLRLPVIVGSQVKALVAGRQDGKIYLWNSYEQLSSRNFVVLDVHTSSIADMSYTFNQKYLYSSGVDDGIIVQWRFAYYNEYASATICKIREQSSFECGGDEVSQRRVGFCRFKNDKLAKNYDQHISIKGIKNDIIRRLFKSNISEWKVSNRLVRLEQPNLHLKMNFVFGIQTYNQNNNVIALTNPKRFVYFVSKVIVIFHPAENSQDFYRGHQFKVTAMVLLQDRVRVASTEAAYKPDIHIWSTVTLETLRIIRTNHRWGIIQLSTHRNIVLSFGFKEIKYEEEGTNSHGQEWCERNMYLYQVVDYEKGLIIAGREEKDLVHSMAINPSDALSFAACVDGRVIFWQVRFNSIIKKKVCWIGGETPTCCVYYNPSKGDPDLLVGTSSGTLGMIARKQYWNIFKRGDKNAKRVNCILVVKRKGETLIVVASEDNLLKIFNQKLQERFRQNMLKIQPTEEGSKKVRESKGDRQNRNCSVQSLSVIMQESTAREQLRMLLGTRNGQILQLIESRENKHINKPLSFKATLFLRFNTSQDTRRVRNKVLMTHHPKLEIIATIGHDQQIIFWDTEHNKLLHVTELPTDNERRYPTAIKFSHSGDHLIVGFSDGELLFLESKMSKSMQAKIDEKYCPLNLGKAKKERDQDGRAVLNIELSQNGEYIAVSYQKIVGDRSYSCIKISHFRIKDRPKTNKNQYDKILDNTSILPCPHLDKSFHTHSGLLFGFAAYSMSFVMSETTSKHYFLSYYQMVDENQNRLSINIEKGEERNYNIWEVSDSIYPVTSPLIESIKWKQFFIHNAIQTNYMFHQTALSSSNEQNPPSNNNLDLTEFTNMVILHKCILATSFNGDIHIFKLATLEGEDCGMIGKTIPAHSCKINQIELFHNQLKSTLYTTGENDQCIIKWVAEKCESLNDSEEYGDEERDIFGEVPDKEELQGKLELYKRKAEVERVMLRNEYFIEWFRVRHIFGRRAEQVRSNLKYDKYNRIIYSSGHSVVIVEGDSNNKEFLYLQEDSTHCLQQIVLVQISKDGELLISCHGGMKAGILIWQLNSKILLKKFYLKETVHILYVVISEDNLRLVVYGLTADLVAQIVMVDVQNQQILGVVTYTNKKPWQIKGLCFRPHSHDTFLSCGVENVKEWRMMSGQLVNVTNYQNQEKVINTCIDFIGDNWVVANDKGELVVWCDSREVTRKQEHQNMINCMAVSDNGFIATGSISSEGNLAQVILWSFSGEELTVLDKISIKHESMPSPILCSKAQGKKARHVDVQSLCMSQDRKKNKILIGVSKGDIYEYCFEPIKKEKGEMKASISIESKATLVASYEDQEKIKSMFFNHDQSQLFQISESGLLRIWKLSKTELQWAHHFQTATVSMVYAVKYDLVIIAFRECIRFYKYMQHQMKELVQVEKNYKQIRCITHLVLGHNDKFIGVGIERNSDRANIIEIYNIAENEFMRIAYLEVDSRICFIDFNRLSSNDKAYMLVNTEKRPELFDLSVPVNINNELIGEIQWMSSGLEFSAKARKTKLSHLERFKDGVITKIIEVGTTYIFFDYYAGIYLYKDGDLIANCHLNISSIDSVAISSSQKWLAVGSKVDRNIVLIELSELIHIQ